jgi:citronellol/citronellal dehydrogenase
MAKFGMSMCVLGMAEELRASGIAVNALWPRTVIATAAVENLLGGDAVMRGARKPEIMADAAHAILTRPSRELTGRFLIDDSVRGEAAAPGDWICRSGWGQRGGMVVPAVAKAGE